MRRRDLAGWSMVGIVIASAWVYDMDKANDPHNEPLVSSTRPFAYAQEIPTNTHRYDIPKAGPQAANFPELAEPPSVTESNPCEGADVCVVPDRGRTMDWPGKHAPRVDDYGWYNATDLGTGGNTKDYRDLGKASDLEVALEDEVNRRAEDLAAEMVESGEARG